MASSKQDIKDVTNCFFQNLFTTVGDHDIDLEDLPIVKLTSNDKVWVGRSLEEVGIEEALWSLPNT